MDPSGIPARLRALRAVAVLGAHTDPSRPACYVPESLLPAGIRVIPVNAALAGQSWNGVPIFASLAEICEQVDILNVFRRADALASHLPEILGMPHRPRLVWLQSGIRNDTFADTLTAEGIEVVQDRCLMVDYRRWGGA